jgi:hypothetical protein
MITKTTQDAETNGFKICVRSVVFIIKEENRTTTVKGT